jgi:ribose transport system permease protein
MNATRRAPEGLQTAALTVLRWLGTQEGVVLIINALLAVALTLASPVFLTRDNLLAGGVAMAAHAITSMGTTLVLLTGGIDLSVGSSFGLAGVIMARVLNGGAPFWVAVVAGIMVGVVIGWINGVVITKLEINPFIATMGTMTMARGLVNVMTQSRSIRLPATFAHVVNTLIFGVPPSFVVMIVSVVVADLLLRYWRPARQFFYIGGSRQHARLIGISVDRLQILAYVLSGALAALSGLLFTLRSGSAHQQAGIELNMKVILSPYLGGVGFMGGGSAFGAFLGALLLGLIFNAIQLLGIAVLWQNVLVGALLLGAALVGIFRMRREMQRSRRERRLSRRETSIQPAEPGG